MCSITELKCSLQYCAEHIEENGLFFPTQNLLQSAVVAYREGEAIDLCTDILARVEVDASWPWQIRWSNEGHFHLSGTVNTHNCRIWDTKNSRTFQEIPPHSPKVSVWYGFTATFIIGPFFFEENTHNGPVTGTVTARRYRKHAFVLPQIQQLQFLDSVTFMHDRATPYIGLCVQQFLRHYFTYDRVINRSFPTIWPPRSPDLNPFDF